MLPPLRPTLFAGLTATTDVWPGHISLRPRTISRLRVVDPARRGSSLGSLATSATSAEWRRTLSAETRRHFPVFLSDLAPRPLPDSPVRYVLKIHFFIEFGPKMIQFKIQFKTKSKIFIQKNIHSKQNQKYSFKKVFIQ